MVRKLLILSIIAMMLLFCGCVCCSNLPIYVPADNTPGGNTVKLPDYKEDDTKAIADSKVVISGAADALAAGDDQKFLTFLSNASQALVPANAKIPDGDAVKVGKAMKEAKMVKANKYYIYYEMTVDGVTYPFNTVLEGDQWKLDGF
jgi:hypothetical protein